MHDTSAHMILGHRSNDTALLQYGS